MLLRSCRKYFDSNDQAQMEATLIHLGCCSGEFLNSKYFEIYRRNLQGGEGELSELFSRDIIYKIAHIGTEMFNNRDNFDVTSDKHKFLEQFVNDVVQAAHEKSVEREHLFDLTSKMASDSNARAEYQNLGKILQKILLGSKDPDLSLLPIEMANIVRKALRG